MIPIEKITEQILNQRFELLPDKLKEALVSDINLGVVNEVCKNHHLLDEEKQLMVQQLVALVILGIIHTYDIEKEMNEALELNNPALVASITKELEAKIFSPIKTELENNYKPIEITESSTKETPRTSPAIPSTGGLPPLSTTLLTASLELPKPALSIAPISKLISPIGGSVVAPLTPARKPLVPPPPAITKPVAPPPPTIAPFPPTPAPYKTPYKPPLPTAPRPPAPTSPPAPRPSSALYERPRSVTPSPAPPKPPAPPRFSGVMSDSSEPPPTTLYVEPSAQVLKSHGTGLGSGMAKISDVNGAGAKPPLKPAQREFGFPKAPAPPARVVNYAEPPKPPART